MKNKILHNLLGICMIALCPIAPAHADADMAAHEINNDWNNDPDVTGLQDNDLEKALLTKSETRCGWFDNPTPSNAWLTDADGQWAIATQGAYNAMGDWPAVENIDDEAMFVRTNGGSYGYSCACLTVKTIRDEKTIVKIENAKTLPLAKCRADKKLKEPVIE